jgi:hypothetical protein
MEEQIMMMRMDTCRRHHRDIVAEVEDEEGVGLEGAMVATIMQWKKLVDTMMGRTTMHHRHKGLVSPFPYLISKLIS